jgi:hypothetical protein
MHASMLFNACKHNPCNRFECAHVLLLGCGVVLGLGPAPSYTFTVFGAAVGAYLKVRP